jgi:hypothetical protein
MSRVGGGFNVKKKSNDYFVKSLVLLEKNNDYFITFFLTNLIATRYSLLTIQTLNETNDC